MSENAQIEETKSLDDILHLLKSVEKNISYNVFIPSLNKELPFKQFSTEQLKRILRTIIDSPLYNTNFILTFNEIIKETSLEATYNSLTILDKVLIVLISRLENISSTYELQFTDSEIDEYNLNTATYTLNLQEIIEKNKSKIKHLEAETFTQNEITVVCEIPTLEIEGKFENDLHKNVKVKLDTQEDLQELIGSTFISEITKFISKLVINSNTIDISNLTFIERIKIIEQLPTPLINKVIQYIEKYKELVNSLLFVEVNTVDTNNNEISFLKELPYNASFFNN